MEEQTIIKPAKPEVKLLYNGKDCTSDFSKYLRSFTFQEFEEEQSDEINLVLNNNDGYFSDLWYPEKGDKLTAEIIFGADIFSCGIFTIDDDTFYFGLNGDEVELKALAASTNTPMRSNKTTNYSGKTLFQIAQEIGKIHGFKVLGNSGNIKTGTVIQKDEADISFLKRIAREYGYIFNIKDGFLTFVELEELKNQDSLFDLFKENCENIKLSDSCAKMYGKARVSYFDNKTKSLKTTIIEGNSKLFDTLTIRKKCSSLEEAQKIAKSALKNGSKEVKGTIKLKNPINNFIVGINFNLFGIGRLEGKYHVKSSTRKIDESGYKVTGEIEKCM